MQVIVFEKIFGKKIYRQVKYLRITKDCVHIRHKEYNVNCGKWEYKKSLLDRCEVTNIFIDYIDNDF